MRRYFVYILKCNDSRYYVGVTNNLERRLQEHIDGNDPKAFTYKRRPIELVYHAEFQKVNQAIEFEKQLKGWSRKKKEAIILNKWKLLHDLSKCKNSSSHVCSEDKREGFGSAQPDSGESK